MELLHIKLLNSSDDYKILNFYRGGDDRSSQNFITLSVSALTEAKVYSNLFDLTDEQEMGHIQLARKAELILIAPQRLILSEK